MSCIYFIDHPVLKERDFFPMLRTFVCKFVGQDCSRREKKESWASVKGSHSLFFSHLRKDLAFKSSGGWIKVMKGSEKSKEKICAQDKI